MRARLRRAAAALAGWISPKWPWLRWLSLALVLTVVVLWPLPAWLTRHPSHGLSAAERLKATNDVRTTLVQALAGLALLGGLFFTARTLRLTAKSTDLAARSMDLNVKNFDLAREEQLTERYTKTVEQLGSDKLDVRLGGIYALERLMVDSEHDHPTIVEVLAAFLREHRAHHCARQPDNRCGADTPRRVSRPAEACPPLG